MANQERVSFKWLTRQCSTVLLSVQPVTLVLCVDVMRPASYTGHVILAGLAGCLCEGFCIGLRRDLAL